MSKIEVDAITQQSGSTLTVGGGASKTVVADATTVTLGRCGGTVALASGATQSGFGRTGTVDWQTGSIKTATFTAANGEGYFCNTTGGAFTVNLPAGSAGAIVSIADYAGTFQTNALTISANGSEKIAGSTVDPILATEGQSVTLVYVDGTQGWVTTADSTENIEGSDFINVSVSGGTNSISTAPCGNYKLAIFTGPGDFTVNSVSPATPANNIVDYLVVAAGGGGSGNNYNSTAGAGAGAGGLRASSTTYTNGGPSSPLTPTSGPTAVAGITVTAQTYPIVVGGGGAGGVVKPNGSPPSNGSNGNNSSALGITSTGGGYGMLANGSTPGSCAAGNGGSGGGNGGPQGPSNPGGGSGNTPPVSPPQGNNGGGAMAPSPSNSGAAGGGGALAVGANGGPAGGAGGVGAGFPTVAVGTKGQNCGSNYYFAGGGGGSGYTPSPGPNVGGTGGLGGGASGKFGNNLAVNATDNQGGGGASPGGSCTPNAFRGGGNGGSGIVIIRYKFQ